MAKVKGPHWIEWDLLFWIDEALIDFAESHYKALPSQDSLDGQSELESPENGS